MKSETRIDWGSVSFETLIGDQLPRVLSEMRIGRHVGNRKRGFIPDWPPAYVPKPAAELWRGYPAPVAEHARICRTEEIAALNRRIRDSRVLVHECDDRHLFIDVFCGEGQWSTQDGANRGASLIELGMWRWAIAFTPSAYRIARIIGLDPIPRVPVNEPFKINVPDGFILGQESAGNE